MRNVQKNIIITCAIFIIATMCFCLAACGINIIDSKAKDPTFIIETVEAKVGDEEVSVSISLKNNPGISSIALRIVYDDTQLILTGFEYNEKFGGQVVPYNAAANPPKLVWVNWAEDIDDDLMFATLFFTVKANATEDCDITVEYNPDDIYNVKEENIKIDIKDGGIVVK